MELSKLPPDSITDFIGATGSVRKNSHSEERIEFSKFYIGTKAQIEKTREQAEKLDIVNLAK